jgi:hypothetical protein
MSSRSTIHRLLFQALLEMRQRGHDSGDNAVYHLADLFHNVALQLDQAESMADSEEYDEILAFLKRRAKEKGCEEWLQQQLEQIELKAAAG